MRNSRFVRLGAVAVAAVTIGACGSSGTPGSSAPPRRLSLLESHGGGDAMSARYPQRPTTYVLDGPLADLGRDGPVRRLVGHEVTAADLVRVADALGMQGTPTRSENGWELHDGDALLTVGTSGAATSVDYTRTGARARTPARARSEPARPGAARPAPGRTPPRSLPTCCRSRRPTRRGPSRRHRSRPSGPRRRRCPPRSTFRVPPIPCRFARSLLDHLDALTGQEWVHDVSDASGVAVSCAADVECEPVPTVVTARTVTSTLVLDGVPVPGVGWSVTLGEHRRVESVSGTWATVEGAGTYALRSTQDVFDDLANGRAHSVGPQPLMAAAEPAPAPASPDSSPVPPIVVYVTGVSLGLARWDGTEGGRVVAYLVPTYRFRTRAADGSPSLIELLALDAASFADRDAADLRRTKGRRTGCRRNAVTGRRHSGGRQDAPGPPGGAPSTGRGPSGATSDASLAGIATGCSAPTKCDRARTLSRNCAGKMMVEFRSMAISREHLQVPQLQRDRMID